MTKALVEIKNKFILDNLSIINRNMDAIIGRVVDPPIKKFMRSYMQQKLKPYPPVPPQSTYIRTRELFRSWDVLANRRQAWAKIINTVAYAEWVVGQRQVSFHATTGWPKLPDHEEPIVKGAAPVASRALESEIFRFLNKRGLV